MAADETERAGPPMRLGALMSEEQKTAPAAENWLDLRDVLRRDHSEELNWVRRWSIYHVCSQPPKPRFLLDRVRELGFEPEHNSADAWEGGNA